MRSFSATNAHKKKKSSRKDWTAENKKNGRDGENRTRDL